MKTNIVITMAGKGSRFYDAGYKVPKYEIEVHGHSLFYWSLKSLKNFTALDCRLIFVCLKDNKSSPYIIDQCEKLNLKDVHVIELDQLTDGQATSAYLSRNLWTENGELVIYNIDTYVNPKALKPTFIKENSDGWIPCFNMPGEHWSFVKLNDEKWAEELTEKRRISDNASIGLYWFAKSQDFIDAYQTYFNDTRNLVRGEKYIAPLYNHLIRQGKRISISQMDIADVHVLGTPAELEIFKQKPYSVIE